LKLKDFAWLADENIHPDVIAELKAQGCDVIHVRSCNLAGADDLALLQLAYSQNRVVLTHDSDFGTLSIARLEPLVGIVFLRPGHINPQFTCQTLQVLFHQELQLTPPFVVVAKRTGDEVVIRVRNL
jgi:predicted nuclease of predicted toxin-antitoxin system